MKKAFVSLIAFILAPFGVAQAQENGTSAANDTTTAWVEMTTNKGVMLIEIDKKNAPLTAANFISYVENGFFDGLIFHRVIPGFVIQGGGFSPEMKQKETAAPIQNEAGNGLKNLRYSLSMARTNDPHSATSQFFINLNDNGNLDRSPSNPGYAVWRKNS
jgi:cyclophilin family peptidyl-prolyl cis-trans isomerase